jgi:DNA-directed RNA polymerase specialized sigma24 family protein
MNERAEATWIARSREETLFASLYHRHYRAIRDFCRRRVPRDVVDDVVAETFLNAWRRIDDVPRGDQGRRRVRNDQRSGLDHE